MFINNINGVINKNLSLFFFPSDIKLAWKAKQKQRELTKNQLFCYFFVFFLKIQDKRKSKTPIFERGQHKNFLNQVWTIFQTGPNMNVLENIKIKIKIHIFVKIKLKLAHFIDNFCLLNNIENNQNNPKDTTSVISKIKTTQVIRETITVFQRHVGRINIGESKIKKKSRNEAFIFRSKKSNFNKNNVIITKNHFLSKNGYVSKLN